MTIHSPFGGNELFVGRDHQVNHDLDVPDDFGHISQPENDGNKPVKKKRESTLRKAPQAPKRFKSSYIIFFMAQQDIIKNELGPKASVGEVSKKSSEKWKKLTPEEKAVWEEKARLDKERYNLEKERYTGPWQVPYKRAKKDPSAPKRPMSAFLYYSQVKRSSIKEKYKGMKNTEISRVLGQMWKNASQEERAPFISREKEERDKYKIKMAKWRQEDANRKEAQREVEAEQIRQVASQRKRAYEHSHYNPAIEVPHPQPPAGAQYSYSYYRGGYTPQHGYYPPHQNYTAEGNYHSHHAPPVYSTQQPEQSQMAQQSQEQQHQNAGGHFSQHDMQDSADDDLKPLPFRPLPDDCSVKSEENYTANTLQSDPYYQQHRHGSNSYHHFHPEAQMSAPSFEQDDYGNGRYPTY